MDLQHVRRALALLIDPTIPPEIEEVQQLHHEIRYHKRTVRELVLKLRRITPLATLSVREADYER